MGSKVALGFHIGHDRGAALVEDGILGRAISQERLDRSKHSVSDEIPFKAIDAILADRNMSIREVDCVAFSGDEISAHHVESFVKQEFLDYYALDDITFYHVDHHLAHAWSTYAASGFDDALVLVADGGGDYVDNMVQAESLYRAKDSELELLESRFQSPLVGSFTRKTNYLLPFMPTFVKENQISLGRKYEQITYLLGFGWGQAGKTMGLASYSENPIRIQIPVTCDLGFSLTYADLLTSIDSELKYTGETFAAFKCRREADIAYAAQDMTERVVIPIVAGLMKKYQATQICFAGGLFLNCILNHKILESCKEIERSFIIPSSGDDGQALGCSFYAWNKHFKEKASVHETFPYIGLKNDTQSIKDTLREFSELLEWECLGEGELISYMSEQLINNKIIGLVRGRTEIGPRALCHRSILANPLNADMKNIMNAKVKYREYFRPFAPVVTAEKAACYFELKADSPYMLLAPQVKYEYRNALPAITHVDGTARVQTIKKEAEPFVHSLLSRFGELSGFPVLLNTSFNLAGEPVVESPRDAINTFLKTRIDLLVLEDYVVWKKSTDDDKTSTSFINQ